MKKSLVALLLVMGCSNPSSDQRDRALKPLRDNAIDYCLDNGDGKYFKRLSDVVPERWKLVDDWKSVQIWAKSNTHPDSIFFTPGGSAGFRTFSDRRCVGKLYDLHLVLSLDPKMVPEIYQRLQDIEIPLINSLDKRRIYWEGKIKNKNSSEIRNKILDEKKYIKIRQKIHFNYIIRDKNFPLKFKKVFSNNTFVVYKMKDLH